MKKVKLQQTAIIGGVPRSPAEDDPIVTNAQADHLVEMGLVKKEDVEDAPDFHSPLDREEIDEESNDFKAAVKAATGKAFDKKVAAEVEKQLEARNQADFDAAVAAEVEKRATGNS